MKARPSTTIIHTKYGYPYTPLYLHRARPSSQLGLRTTDRTKRRSDSGMVTLVMDSRSNVTPPVKGETCRGRNVVGVGPGPMRAGAHGGKETTLTLTRRRSAWGAAAPRARTKRNCLRGRTRTADHRLTCPPQSPRLRLRPRPRHIRRRRSHRHRGDSSCHQPPYHRESRSRPPSRRYPRRSRRRSLAVP